MFQHKVTNYLLKYKVFIDISAMIAQFVEGLTFKVERLMFNVFAHRSALTAHRLIVQHFVLGAFAFVLGDDFLH